MARIFVSYARADRERVRPFVQVLRDAGHRVWWDTQLSGGDDFAERIERELRRSDLAVAFLTPAAVDSVWVRIEATIAKRLRILVPVRLEPVPLPGEIADLHAVDVPEPDREGRVLDEVRGFLARRARRRRGPVLAVAAATLLCAFAGGCWLAGACGVPGGTEPRPPAVPAGVLRVAFEDLELAGGPEGSPIAAGLPVLLGHRLDRLPGVSVAARADLAAVAGTDGGRRRLLDRTVGGTLTVRGDRAELALRITDERTGAQRDLAPVTAGLGEPARLERAALRALTEALAVASGAAASGDPGPGRVDHVYAEGLLAAASTIEGLGRAEAALLDVIHRDGRFAPAYAGLCEALTRRFGLTRERALHEEAQGWCDQARRLDDSDPRVHRALGRLALFVGEAETAQEHFATAVRSGGGVAADLGLAEAYLELDALDRAEGLLEACLIEAPWLWRCHDRLGQLLARRGDLDGAIARLRMAARIAPGNPTLQNNLGWLLLQAERLPEALEAWERAVAGLEGLDRIPTLVNVAGLHYLLGDFEAACAALETAVALDSRDFRAWANLADARRALGRDDARAAYERALALIAQEEAVAGPSLALTANRLSNRAALGEPGVQDALRELSEAPGADAEVHRLLALTAVRSGVPGLARSLLERAVGAGYPQHLLAADPEFEPLLRPPHVTRRN
jgi:Tfp pilus assembly protein PilF